MRLTATIRISLRNLQRTPIRTCLTALGVIIGVGAVVTTMDIGEGAKRQLEIALLRPESRTIYLGAVSQKMDAQRVAAPLLPGSGLTLDDFLAIRNSVRNLAAATPKLYNVTGRAFTAGRMAEVIIEGQAVDGFLTHPRPLLQGAIFSNRDVKLSANVCVITQSLANRLFAEHKIVGRRVRLNNDVFVIVGIVGDSPQSGVGASVSSDFRAYVPYTSFLHRLDRLGQLSIDVQADEIAHLATIQQQLSDLMEERRRGRTAAFITGNAVDALTIYADGTLTVARLLAALGAVALVVGGVGIMNIMLVSISERTREIGIRLAVGTRGEDVLRQFLFEAIALSSIGGVIGIALGLSVSWIVAQHYDWSAPTSARSVAIALILSVVVGLVFGVNPARRAALLNPIDALRVE